MKGKIFIICAFFIILLLVSLNIYKLLNVPTYSLERNVQVVVFNGTEYSISKVTINGDVYYWDISADPAAFTFGKLIGQTQHGERIYEVKNDKSKVMITSFMSPQFIYTKDKRY
ncbi:MULTISPECIES: hypothetical protein [Bacillales]|jgi:hypothetical protein|uniref:Cupredoxin-1 domain-containing protein n=1 Tax=Brevibacillus aydinogluensis TaxID=927786 RepID=A0AA48RGS6_9BACL|nr:MULTISPECIES: hypothetical protein [Bacillales]REK65197.1 MAG: hypothetical protein DF221_06455 [Brevibacillus sp.]MBR8658739.1 hypothetical protein [Brevibacillus sp. NL20B1]MDT3416062.1 hypothetical protein [Brevibacillus aydinogluensis]NNV03017.1 hypothetical protein [Brevibacillus sp. MCWH]UFJ61604.1 hypothetical protein IRT44_01735 [Anoxybacillus sediminis]